MNRVEDPIELNFRRGGLLVLRALRLRCPHCGQGPLFSSWIRMHQACRHCGLLFDRGAHDYFIGGYLVNLIVAELIVVAGMLAVLLMTWPDVPWTLLTYGLIALMIPAPFVTYPYSKALWLAIDLHFQPVTEADFADPANAGASGASPGGPVRPEAPTSPGE